MKRARALTSRVLAIAALGACGCSAAHEASDSYSGAATAPDAGASQSRAAEGDSAPVDASDPAARAPSFDDVYAIIHESCGGGNSGCHVGAAPAMLAMPDADTAYANLIGVASSKCEGQTRVVPGDPDTSVLVGTLDGTISCSQRMPRGRDPLPEAQLETIRAWITAGAHRD